MSAPNFLLGTSLVVCISVLALPSCGPTTMTADGTSDAAHADAFGESVSVLDATPEADTDVSALDAPERADVSPPVDARLDSPDVAVPDASGVPRILSSTRWHIDLENPVDLAVAADAYDIDMFDTAAADISRLRARGVTVVCYFSAGSAENWRPDYARIPSAALGSPLAGWPGERWLDIRNTAVRTIMLARLDLARMKGCQGVDPDNVDGYANASGFTLQAADQLDYNRFLAREAHARGLAVGLKNDLDQVAALVADFDFAVNEQCHQYTECDRLAPFISAGRSVLNIEYAVPAAMQAPICADSARRMFYTVLPPRDRLDGTFSRCP